MEAVAAILLGMISRYVGSGPYCYANCLAMALADGTDPGLLEVLTGSPFGMQLLAGRRPFFDPMGWDPEIGIDAALELLGWSCQRSDSGDADAALKRLQEATRSGPVFAGPVEMGLLWQQPGAGGAIGADHYLLVLAADGEVIRFHDPDGHPYATLPAETFVTAWRGDSIDYAKTEYTMRTGFRRSRETDPLDALRASVPAAIAWLSGQPGQAPPATLGAGEAALALADMVQAGLSEGQRDELVSFAVPVGARRLADAEYWLAQIGLHAAAEITGAQARLVGSLQNPFVTGNNAIAANILRDLAPTYLDLRQALTA